MSHDKTIFVITCHNMLLCFPFTVLRYGLRQQLSSAWRSAPLPQSAAKPSAIWMAALPMAFLVLLHRGFFPMQGFGLI